MDFFADQEQARRRTGWLVVYFAAAVAAIVMAVYLVTAMLVVSFRQHAEPAALIAGLWRPDVFFPVAIGTLSLITGGSLWRTASLFSGGRGVAESLGGRQINPDTRDPPERQVLNVVEEMAIAAGVPVPPVYLLERESAINAFAAGFRPTDAVIGVTRGAIQQLNRDQLQGVMGHEFSHILNGDMRINLRLIGLLYGILLISHVGWVIFRLTANSSSRVGLASNSDRKGGNPLPLFGLALYAIGYLGVFFGRLIQAAVSRQREFLADASAVQFTRNPEGLAGALIRIGALSQGSRLTTPQAEESCHLFFGNALGTAWLQLLATHPPLDERIRRIWPAWDGQFARATERKTVPNDAGAAAGHELPPSLASALAPQATLPLAPRRIEDAVGDPRPEHFAYSEQVLADLPEDLLAAVREPVSAVGLVCALVAGADRETAAMAEACVRQYLGPGPSGELARLAPEVARLRLAWRLPVAELAIPTLQQLAPSQYAALSRCLEQLIAADRRLSLFEFALERLLVRHVGSAFRRPTVPRVRYSSLEPLAGALSHLLSALAHAGETPRAVARAAFERAAEVLPPVQPPLRMLSPDACDLAAVGRALDMLAAATPDLRRRVLKACAECVVADGRTTVAEAELLRAIAATFDCPLPPFLPRLAELPTAELAQ